MPEIILCPLNRSPFHFPPAMKLIVPLSSFVFLLFASAQLEPLSFPYTLGLMIIFLGTFTLNPVNSWAYVTSTLDMKAELPSAFRCYTAQCRKITIWTIYLYLRCSVCAWNLRRARTTRYANRKQSIWRIYVQHQSTPLKYRLLIYLEGNADSK
jgi:hypothetical protein